jgi:ribosomal protein S18 acetylase RimI-like enzyme
MDREITIRPAQPEDQPGLLHIMWQTVLDSESDRETLLARPELVQVPIEHLAPATACVAEISGKLAGFAVVLPRPDGQAELDGLFVDPALQRRGIGRALIAQAMHLAGTIGASELYVVANEDALAFYSSVGFVEIGRADTTLRAAPLMRLTL